MGRQDVNPVAGDSTTQRFRGISLDLSLALTSLQTAASSAKAHAGDSTVADAIDLFRAGLAGVLSALVDDVDLVADAARAAGIDDQINHDTALTGSQRDG